MKNLVKTFLVMSCVSLTIVNASAAGMADLQIGESFVFQGKPDIFFGGSDYGTLTGSSEFPIRKECYNARIYTFEKVHYFGGQLVWPINERYFLGYKYANQKDCAIDVEYASPQLGYNSTFLMHSWGAKTEEQIYRVIGAPDVKEELVLERLSRDGKSIYATLKLDTERVRKESLTGKLRIAADLELVQCIDAYGQVINKEVNLFLASVSDVLESLRQSQFSNYARCTLKPKTLSYIDRLSSLTSLEARNFSYEIFKDEPDSLSILKDDRIVSKLSRHGVATVSGSEKVAIDAANVFTSLIIDQYGDLLYALSEKTKISQEEKNETVRAFFDKKGVVLKTQLDIIDSEFPKLSLMTKLSVLVAINDVYAKVAAIEKLVVVSRSISLDKVIQRRL